MPKFRKKPVIIEAVQWNGDDHRAIYDFLEPDKKGEYLSNEGDNFYLDFSKVTGGLVIKTKEGEHIASIGDFIIKGVAGEYYPCKPDIFEQTYEPAE